MVGAPGRVVAVDINSEMLAVGGPVPYSSRGCDDRVAGGGCDQTRPAGRCVRSGTLPARAAVLFIPACSAWRDGSSLGPERARLISVWQTLERHSLHQALFAATTRHLGVAISAVDVSFSLPDVDKLRSLLSNAGFQHIGIVERSIDIHLPSPELFVELTVKGAATSIPVFADASEQARLVEAVSRDVRPLVDRSKQSGELTFPMITDMASAYSLPQD
jgi:hypothetical protein